VTSAPHAAGQSIVPKKKPTIKKTRGNADAVIGSLQWFGFSTIRVILQTTDISIM